MFKFLWWKKSPSKVEDLSKTEIIDKIEESNSEELETETIDTRNDCMTKGHLFKILSVSKVYDAAYKSELEHLVPTGKRYVLQCIFCGDIKSKDV